MIPEARTAAEKLNMRGEAVTVENIGKTVTDGFERVTNNVNDYMKSDKPRTSMQRTGDTLLMIVGWFLKICLIIVAIICSPVLFCFRYCICGFALCRYCSCYWWWCSVDVLVPGY